MSETVVVNVALIVRVLLVGALLLVLPRMTRKGLLFGVYVGESVADHDEARRLRRSWDLGCAGAMALALSVGWSISLAGWPLAGNLTGTAVLLAAALVTYVRIHGRARTLVLPDASRQARMAIASLDTPTTSTVAIARATLALCLLTSIATFAYAATGYSAMPESVPTLSSAFGRPGMTDRSIITALWFPGLNLVLSPFIGLLALLTATAKRSLRGGGGGGSIAAQEAFRAMNVRFTSGTALLVCAALTAISIQVVRVELSESGVIGPLLWWVAGAMLAAIVPFVLAFEIRIARRFGQGGAFFERGDTDSPLVGGLADNAHWVGGLFYVDRDDPSVMVEKRFGFGYGFNYGNRTAQLVAIAMFGALAVLATLAAVGLAG